MRKQTKTYLIQFILLVVTIITTTLAGMYWMGLGEYTWENFSKGLWYSVPFLGILTVHEFGHYIASRIYKLDVTLPYYIPFYIPMMGTIGTLGALIKIKSPLTSKRMVMDVGIAGPLAGFVVALAVIYYGFTHLPPKEYVFTIHPEYANYGKDYEKHVYTYEFAKERDSLMDAANKSNPSDLTRWLENKGMLKEEWRKEPFKAQPAYMELALGKNLLFLFFEKYIVKDASLIPNKYEMCHYPLLFAGFLALFFTALNLLPMGQLDGGHVIYGLFGSKWHEYISKSAFVLLIYLAGIGVFRTYLSGTFTDLLIWGAIYVYFIYYAFSKLTNSKLNNLTVAACVVAAQFFTEFFFPSFKGIGVLYFVFGLIVGRVLGLSHPVTYEQEPLSTSRKVLGWISLIVFVLCFTPEIFTEEIFRAY